MSEPRMGSLFSGYLGLDRGVQSVVGGQTVWVSDIDKGASKILAHRAPDAPNLGDITKIDWAAVEPVDILTGGFPCQDVSLAGLRKGLSASTRSGLWSHFAIAIQQLQPQMVVIENVRGLLSAKAASSMEHCPECMGDPERSAPSMRALGAVLADLAEIGYDASWCGLRATDVGACHNRFRVFLLATPANTNSGGNGENARRQALQRATTPRSGDSSGEPAERLALLPTPTAQIASNGGSQHPDKRRAGGHGPTIADAAEHLLSPISWGKYEAAIRRCEQAWGLAAPAPTQPGKAGLRLAPRFVEWMMGLPEGWVTDVPDLSRAQQIKALGNGVVWQQAAAAISHLLQQESDNV